MTRLAALTLALLASTACLPDPVTTVVLTPETPELAKLLRAADERWEAAGVAPERIVIGPGGAPVTRVDHIAENEVLGAHIPEGYEAHGETRIRKRGRTYIGVRWMRLASTDPDVTAHEVGHALGVYIGFTAHETGDECESEATDRPLMCADGGDKQITAHDLELACAAGRCTHFTPEVPEAPSSDVK